MMLNLYVAWRVSEILFVYLPTVLTLATMEETDKEANDDGRAEHRQRNDQRLEVYCHEEEKRSIKSFVLCHDCFFKLTSLLLNLSVMFGLQWKNTALSEVRFRYQHVKY